MSDRVSVTIGIPFLNARRYLEDAVRSVFAQTHGDWELLLIDDGSTDGSIAVVRHLDDPRVRVLGDGSNRGLCARLNQIASLAQGTYLARMDADDLMHPERIERQLKFLRANPNVDLIDTATSPWTTSSRRWAFAAIVRWIPVRGRCYGMASSFIRPSWGGLSGFAAIRTIRSTFVPRTASCGAEPARRRTSPGCASRCSSIAKASPATCGTIFALKGPCATSCVATARRWSGGGRHGSW